MSSGSQDKVIYLYRHDPQAALVRLNRITGLCFSRWPESLVPPGDQPAGESQQEVPLSSIGVA